MTSTLNKLKENGRDRLIAASLKLFSHKGFHACTIREICDKARANISLVSFHFGGKEGLLDVIFDELNEDDFDVINSVLSNVSSREDLKIRLKLFLDSYAEYSLKHADVVSLFFEEMERGNPQAEKRMKNTFGKVWSALNSFLKDAQDHELIPIHLDTQILSYQILSPISNLCRSRHTSTQVTFFSLKNAEFREKLHSQIIDTNI